MLMVAFNLKMFLALKGHREEFESLRKTKSKQIKLSSFQKLNKIFLFPISREYVEVQHIGPKTVE